MTRNYMLDATGQTIDVVDLSLGTKMSGLVEKLEKAKVSTKLPVVKQVYKVSGSLMAGKGDETVKDNFEYRSPDGWCAVIAKASKGRDLNHCALTYSSEMFLRLTESQRKALEPKRTPAGNDGPGTSDGYGLRGLLR